MTKKQCWRYKCDFCGRVGYSGGHMKSHEIGCTANINRVCRMPIHDGEAPRLSLHQLIDDLSLSKPDLGMTELREDSNNCPACILAAIRCSGLQKYDPDPETGENCGPDFKFNFKQELASMWSCINDDNHNDYRPYDV